MIRLTAFLRRHRPGAPMIVALIALFVALGGPAQAERVANQVATRLARGTVTSAQVKDHSLQVADLSRKTVRRLERTPRGSVTESRLRNGAVTPGKLAKGSVRSTAIADRAVQGGDIALGAVGSLEVADNSLTGADVADGALDARDIGRFWGHFSITVGPVLPGKCWQGDPVGLAPERSAADISSDLIKVTPGAAWPSSLTFAARVSTTNSRFTILACNPTATVVAAVSVPFNYVIIHVP